MTGRPPGPNGNQPRPGAAPVDYGQGRARGAGRGRAPAGQPPGQPPAPGAAAPPRGPAPGGVAPRGPGPQGPPPGGVAPRGPGPQGLPPTGAPQRGPVPPRGPGPQGPPPGGAPQRGPVPPRGPGPQGPPPSGAPQRGPVPPRPQAPMPGQGASIGQRPTGPSPTAPPPGTVAGAGSGRAIPGRGTPPQIQRPGPPGASPTAVPGGAPRSDPAGRAVFRAEYRSGETPSPGVRVDSGSDSASVSSRVASLTLGGSGNGSAAAAAGSAASGNGGNGGNAGNGSEIVAVGRGAQRGRVRPRGEILRTRPADIIDKKGSGGDVFRCAANYFRMVRNVNWILIQYRVDFAPEEDSIRVKKDLVKQHAERLGKFIFDGTMLFALQRYTPDNSPLVLTSKRLTDDTIVQVTFKPVGEVHPDEYHYLHCLNILLREIMKGLNLDLVGRNYFDSKAKTVIPEFKLEIWPGYITSIRQHENELLLCCETASKVLRTDTVRDLMASSKDKASQQKSVLGIIVMTKYNNKMYKVDDIDYSQSPMSTFPRRDGTQTSYMEYYATRWDIKIKDPKQPLLKSRKTGADRRAAAARGESDITTLVPELCFMTGLTDEQRANFKLMKAMGDVTRAGPQQRFQQLVNFAQRIKMAPTSVDAIKNWNMEFSTELEQFSGRTFPPEQIIGGRDRKCSYPVENAEWNGVFKMEMFNPIGCQKWAVIYPQREADPTKAFIDSLLKVSGNLGFKLSPPKPIVIQNDRADSYVNELRKVSQLTPQMVMAVIPNNRGNQYAAIKKVCCIEEPVVPSQVVTATVIKKPKGLMSVATKVAVQMACKLGAEPWAVSIPLKDTMVIGYDSFHDSQNKNIAVGAVVSTINQSLTRFTSSCTFHSNDEELINQMKQCITKALRAWHGMNGSLPQRVIVYRDGVGDGQIEMVKELEIKAIRSIFSESQFAPKFTYVIVAKRINSRFFKMNAPGAKGAMNPPSGSVVDDVVTLPERYDFFLVSQSVRQGTVNPTSYNVIEDSSGLRPDHIQKLTYKLTHLYYNWPGTVRVPCVCQYAHKLATLVGSSLHKQPHKDLENLLYYL